MHREARVNYIQPILSALLKLFTILVYGQIILNFLSLFMISSTSYFGPVYGQLVIRHLLSMFMVFFTFFPCVWSLFC